MSFLEEMLKNGKTNFVLIGEAGCGKSEISLNFARRLRELSDKPVHFFDLDMTKPLFRSRDVFELPELAGIHFHYEEQFYDAPTQVGGVRELMKDENSIVVLDVGGDDIGARAIGGYMLGPGKQHSAIFYVLNAYRPLCQDIDHIDQILGEILAVSHIGLEEVHFLDNPNLGSATKIEDVLEGAEKMRNIISPYRDIELTCVHEDLAEKVKERLSGELFRVRTYLAYPWIA